MIKADTFFKGADISTLLEVEACGGRYFDQGIQKDLLDILKSYDFNLIRLRLWNDPYDTQGNSYGAGGCDFDFVIKMAQRIKAAGMYFLLDYHYSDFWADPGKQIVPKAWQGMSEEELVQAVYDYTCSTLEELKALGLAPDIVAVGNELTHGLLWPYGRVPNYESITKLVSSGVKAVNHCLPKAKVMIHLDNGSNQELYQTWVSNYFHFGGRDFDYIGLSYYPFWHGSFDDLFENMNKVGSTFQKDMIVVETSFAYTLEDYQAYEELNEDERKGMATKEEVIQHLDYAISKEGQCAYVRDLIQGIRNVKEQRGKGFVYWEPAWIPVAGSEWATEAGIEYMHEKGPGGNEWANQALFDYQGNALKALQVIKEG